MERIDEKLSAKFANMAFVCACLVVAQHMPFDMGNHGWAKQKVTEMTTEFNQSDLS